jgi:hypothetical protein
MIDPATISWFEIHQYDNKRAINVDVAYRYSTVHAIDLPRSRYRDTPQFILLYHMPLHRRPGGTGLGVLRCRVYLEKV